MTARDLSKVVKGKLVDPQTRCEHYHGPLDVVAIKFPCCGTYYPCHLCHDAIADHKSFARPRASFGERAILCGVCSHELTVHEYLSCNYVCPHCAAKFNPACANHAYLYFER